MSIDDFTGRQGVEVVPIGDEATAEREIAALRSESGVIGLDIETAPRREYAADAGAVLDPLKAEVRLLQIATESKALVIDLRKVPLSSPALSPIWRGALVGHNLSFDAKMLMANGVDFSGAEIRFCCRACSYAASQTIDERERAGLHLLSPSKRRSASRFRRRCSSRIGVVTN